MATLVSFAPMSVDVLANRFPGIDIRAWDPGDDPAEVARGADIVITDWSNRVTVSGPVVDALAGSCRLVQVPAAGTDSVDVDACLDAGVPVASCAGLNTAAVAEWCVWGAIDALRQLSASERALRRGEWQQLGHVRFELAGKTVGIVGLGDIGTACAERFAAFGVDLRYWSRRRRSPDEEARLGVTWSELDELVATSHVLVLTVALTPQTRHLLDAARLATMPANAVVVNAARGEVVDEAALAAALVEGRLHGAAVDVFSVEPPPDDHPLFAAASAVMTPHVGGASAEAVGRILTRVFENVDRVLRDERPEGLLDA